jgi:hypothetical protein
MICLVLSKDSSTCLFFQCQTQIKYAPNTVQTRAKKHQTRKKDTNPEANDASTSQFAMDRRDAAISRMNDNIAQFLCRLWRSKPPVAFDRNISIGRKTNPLTRFSSENNFLLYSTCDRYIVTYFKNNKPTMRLISNIENDVAGSALHGAEERKKATYSAVQQNSRSPTRGQKGMPPMRQTATNEAGNPAVVWVTIGTGTHRAD